MALLDTITHREKATQHRPWPRAVVTDDGWQQAIDHWRPAAARCSDCGAMRRVVHMALLDETSATSRVVSYTCKDGTYPSVGAQPSAGDPARTRDPRSVRPGRDRRARYAALARSRVLGCPPSARQTQPARKPQPYEFLPAEGEGLHQIPVGPVHAGIIEPGHFRFTANGEHVVRLEQRLGYVHKGIESLMPGATLEQARRSSPRAPPATARSPMPLPSRRPSRPRCRSTAPPRALYLRALMAELERLANHFGDIGAICNDASFALMHAQTRHPARTHACARPRPASATG